MAKTDYIGGIQNEWYTPPNVIALVKDVLGEIDVDPSSSPLAQEVVKAKVFYTEENSGLAKEWNGRVFMNPPYASKLIAQFVSKLCQEYKEGRTTEAIVLTHNCTDSGWFHELASEASALCLYKKRVKFWKPGTVKDSPSRGQVFCYIGKDCSRFLRVFGKVGIVARVMKDDV